jgi:hypothetical protein
MEQNFTDENIFNHFLENPDFRKVFNENFPNYTKESYAKDVLKLFNDNCVTFNHIHQSKNRNSQFYKVVETECYIDGEWQWALVGHISNNLEQCLIHCICEYKVDFSKFK